MTLEDAILEVATMPDPTPFRARAILREADPSARVYELRDGDIWLGIGHGENWPSGPDWMTLADWAEFVS